MPDSKLWEEVFKAYRSTSAPLTPRAQRRKNRRLRRGKIGDIKFNTQATSTTITETTKDFYRWKKTEDYTRWRRKRFIRQGGLCFYCEDWLPLTRINVEHIVPRSRGGTNHRQNLALACSNCNKNKGSSMLSEEQIQALKSRSKKHRGTYLKNKEHFENLYGQYTIESFAESVSNY